MEKLRVEVVYALPQGEDCVSLLVSADSTLAAAVAASGIVSRHPELRPDRLRVGVFGQEKLPQSQARDGDRIEIYRPLTIDPKDARRKRAARKARRS